LPREERSSGPRVRHTRNTCSVSPERTGQRLESEKCIKIGTWNIRTLNKPGALQYTLNAIQNYNIDILCLQEVRWPGEGIIKKNDKTIFYSGNRNGKCENGVGFVINETTLPHVKTFQALSERICYIRVTGHIFDIVIINCYAPTEEKGEDIKESFYEELDRVWDVIPNSCVKIVLGDFNAKVGREEMYQPTIGRESLHDRSNDNGTRLINFCMTNGLTLSSTYFPRKDIYKQTRIAPNRVVKNQIDHVMIQNKRKGCIQNVRSYRGADADSDHYLVIARFTLRISEKRRTTKIKSSIKYSIEKLRDEQIHEYYSKTTHDEILKTMTENSEENVEQIWKNIQSTVAAGAKKCLGMCKSTKKNPWFNASCKEIIDKRNKLREIALKHPTNENIVQYTACRKEANKTLRREKRLDMKRKIEEMENNRYNPKQFFNASNTIKQGFKQQAIMIKNQAGELITNKREVAEEFKIYFDKLLNNTTIRTNEYIY